VQEWCTFLNLETDTSLGSTDSVRTHDCLIPLLFFSRFISASHYVWRLIKGEEISVITDQVIAALPHPCARIRCCADGVKFVHRDGLRCVVGLGCPFRTEAVQLVD
jgi:hypothetical protein